MPNPIRLLSFLLLATITADACVTAKTAKAVQKIPLGFLKSTRQVSNELPFAEGAKTTTWEARLGNLLLREPKSVVLSIPVKIQNSDYHPFGDGQSNAKLFAGDGWTAAEFPVIGVLAAGKRDYRFHPSLGIKTWKETALGDDWFEVRPDGWKNSFYLSFKTGILPITEFVKGIPASLRTLSGGRVAPNPGGIAKGSGVERFKKDMGAGYNKDAWYNDNVHGRYPHAAGETTAVGGVLTWGIVDKAFGPFKHLYTCFESRNAASEKQSGAPSGAGFHRIGDAAETILHSIDEGAIPAALGRTHGKADPAYGLGESIAATWILPGDAFVSVQGEFHWYANPVGQPVCTEIWVHNCVPSLSNNWGFRCGQ